MSYDAIVVGASFAGLSVVGQIRGKVLLIDRREIGAGQASACATYLEVAERLNCLESVVDEQCEIIVHTATRSIRYRLLQPFCTFNYGVFCRTLAGQCQFEWLKASVVGIKGNEVITDRGSFSSKCVVDASGWRAALSKQNGSRQNLVGQKSVGIECLGQEKRDALHFTFDPKVVAHGYGWVFPVGRESRIGVCSYRSGAKLKPLLADFTGDTEVDELVHGGVFPSAIRPATVGSLFVVGDAAGHCLPVTGEGIRTAIYFGEACGRFVQQIIAGEISLEAGLIGYRDFVARHRMGFVKAKRLQTWLERVPNSWATKTAVWGEKHFEGIMRRYTRLADPALLKGPLKKFPTLE